MSKELPKFMTKGGPGDASRGGNVNTDAWFVDPLKTHDDQGRKRNEWRLIPDLLDKGTLAQKAKDQELFFCDIHITIKSKKIQDKQVT